MANDYGKRGGTSANAGKKSAIYEATLPDGTVSRTRSFAVSQDNAFVGCYQYQGQWRVSGVFAEIPAWATDASCGQTFIEAKKS